MIGKSTQKCLSMAVLAFFASCASADSGEGVGESTRGQQGHETRYETSVQTVHTATIQGVVFAGHTVWHCVKKKCSAHIANRNHLREDCAALELQVGRLSYCDGNVNGSLYAPGAYTGPDNKLLIVPNSSRFLFIKKHEKYVIEEIHRPDTVVPAEWLYTIRSDDRKYIDYFPARYFYKQVQEFEIGPGLRGLHISSYNIMKDGSMQLAAGRDVFLVYDQTTHQVRAGGLPLAVTMSRYRSEGAWRAENHKYFIRDVNEDGYTDIGVLKETAICIPFSGPNIISGKLSWYLYDNGSWKISEQDLPVLPTSSRHEQLPLVGLYKSPIDFVIGLCEPAARSHVKR